MDIISLANGVLTSEDAEKLKQAIVKYEKENDLSSLRQLGSYLIKYLNLAGSKTVSELDHIYCIGAVLSSVIDTKETFSRMFPHHRLRDPAGSVLMSGFQGESFDQAYEHYLGAKKLGFWIADDEDEEEDKGVA